MLISNQLKKNIPSPTWIYLLLTSNSRFLFTHLAYSFICKNRSLNILLLFTDTWLGGVQKRCLCSWRDTVKGQDTIKIIRHWSRCPEGTRWSILPPWRGARPSRHNPGNPAPPGPASSMGWTRDYCWSVPAYVMMLIQWHISDLDLVG